MILIEKGDKNENGKSVSMERVPIRRETSQIIM